MKIVVAISIVAVFMVSCSSDEQLASDVAADAEAAYDRGEYESAIPLYTKVIELDSNNPGFFANRGNCHSYLEQFDKAFADFDKSIAVAIEMTGNRDDPRLAFLFYNRGSAKERSGDFGSALNDYGEALRVDPEYPDAHGNSAWILATSPDSALCDGKKAVEFATIEARQENMKNPSDLDTLAAALAEIGNFDAAVETQEKAISLATSKEEKRNFLIA
ncbi:MAG: tetratricopeptide repeat protein [Verrucomicrobiales bacterium]